MFLTVYKVGNLLFEMKVKLIHNRGKFLTNSKKSPTEKKFVIICFSMFYKTIN